MTALQVRPEGGETVVKRERIPRVGVSDESVQKSVCNRHPRTYLGRPRDLASRPATLRWMPFSWLSSSDFDPEAPHP